MSRPYRGGGRPRGRGRGGNRGAGPAHMAQGRPMATVAANLKPEPENRGPSLPHAPSPAPFAPAGHTLFAQLHTSGVLATRMLDAVHQNLKYTVMSPVQAATLEPILQGKDVLAQAKTGTGKTLAFLIPAIQTLLASPRSSRSIRAVVVSPTRELSRQIAEEARVLCSSIPEVRIHTSTGGTNPNTDARGVLSCPDLLVATPGRLKDHLSHPDRVSCFNNVEFFVLDEADNLVDQGFYPDIQTIMRSIPPSNRQTLLFSATIPRQVETIASTILKPGYAHITTISPDDVNTHDRVPQSVYYAPSFNDMHALTLSLIKRELAGSDGHFKAMCFYPTARQTELSCELFSLLPLPKKIPVMQIHSRISQSKRDKVAESFRNASSALLFSSDVTARGMDFPDVTHVFQIGTPSSKEQYIHRLGRTARAGKDGEGFLVLSSYESFFMRELSGLPIQQKTLKPEDADLQLIASKMPQVSTRVKSQTYAAWMGYYKGYLKKMRWTPQDLVAAANDMAVAGMGLEEPPLMWTQTVGKMGLKGVPGLRLTKVKPTNDD